MKKIIESTIRDFISFSKEEIEYEIYRNQKTGHITHNGKKWTIVFRVECRLSQVKIIKQNYTGQDLIIIAEKVYGTAKEEMKKSGIFFIEHNGSFYWKLNNQLYWRDKINKYDKIKAVSRNEITFSQFLAAKVLKGEILYHLN